MFLWFICVSGFSEWFALTALPAVSADTIGPDSIEAQFLNEVTA